MDDDIPRATVPADIDTPDAIAWGLSFRQLSIIAVVAGAGWLAYASAGALLPPAVWLVLAVPVAAGTAVVVLGRRDGLPLEAWLRHGLQLRRVPRRQVPGAPADHALTATAPAPPVPAPLRGPAVQVAADGTLTVDGTERTVIACGTANIALRTGAEQAALLAGFGQWLTALNAPAQFVVAAHRHHLGVYADAVDDARAGLPDAALRAAADDYAAFLRQLDTDREPLRRQIVCVVAQGASREATVRGFAAIGVAAEVLDGPQVAAVLAAAVDPYDPPVPGPRAVPGEPLRLRRQT
ncbi:PrgI family protein [Actinoplanes sp. DH11]|uniref:PrgI family protein n=1 Tax=Actinoplanes sp. DH11 TaxID=2857011 RepID=UPI001E63C26B|nr:PrgI family protein [Actinoplanes sp. DH11]